MTKNLTILTGASRGMGQAMAFQLLEQGHMLLCISRTLQPAQALPGGGTLLQWTHDLSDCATLVPRLEDWLHQQGDNWDSATLINNAGVMADIAPLSEAQPDNLSRALRVGLEAPMQLTAAFLRASANWSASRKVLNISSGLGRRAMASQAAYCAAKAGMDLFTRCLALEEAIKLRGAKVCSLAPGVIDTDMQIQLRAADVSAFPDHASFVGLKTGGKLTSPDEAARRVLAYLAREDFGHETIADVRG